MKLRNALWRLMVGALCSGAVLAEGEDPETFVLTAAIAQSVRSDASNAFARLSQKSEGLPHDETSAIKKELSELSDQHGRDSAYRRILEQGAENVPLLVEAYSEEKNTEVRRDMLSLMGRIEKGEHFRDVLMYLQGECLSSNETIQVSAIHAVARIVSTAGRREEGGLVDPETPEEVNRARALLVKLANDGEPPYSRVQRVAAEHLYDMGEGEHIPKAIRDSLKSGPQK